MTKLNSRQKRKFRYYGMTQAEALEKMAKLKENAPKPRVDHCSYMDYRTFDEKHHKLIKEAQRLGISGKHTGSKPSRILEKRIYSMHKTLARYATAYNAMMRLKEQEENGQDN